MFTKVKLEAMKNTDRIKLKNHFAESNQETASIYYYIKKKCIFNGQNQKILRTKNEKKTPWFWQK